MHFITNYFPKKTSETESIAHGAQKPHPTSKIPSKLLSILIEEMGIQSTVVQSQKTIYEVEGGIPGKVHIIQLIKENDRIDEIVIICLEKLTKTPKKKNIHNIKLIKNQNDSQFEIISYQKVEELTQTKNPLFKKEIRRKGQQQEILSSTQLDSLCERSVALFEQKKQVSSQVGITISSKKLTLIWQASHVLFREKQTLLPELQRDVTLVLGGELTGMLNIPPPPKFFISTSKVSITLQTKNPLLQNEKEFFTSVASTINSNLTKEREKQVVPSN